MGLPLSGGGTHCSVRLLSLASITTGGSGCSGTVAWVQALATGLQGDSPMHVDTLSRTLHNTGGGRRVEQV